MLKTTPMYQLTTATLLVLLLQCHSASGELCMLCEDGVEGLHFPMAVIKSDGTTCTEMAIDLAMNYDGSSLDCSQQMKAWRQICCGDERPIDVEVTDVFDEYPDIDSIQTVGPHPKCRVCRDGDYPSASSMVITMLYIGSGSCPQYWKAGQQGLIPEYLCDPLQYFAYEPCGCGEFSTNGNYNWGSSSSSSTNGNSPSNTENDDDEWWAGADSINGESPYNGNYQGDDDKDDDDASPWWAGADSLSDDWWLGANSISASEAHGFTMGSGGCWVMLIVGVFGTTMCTLLF